VALPARGRISALSVLVVAQVLMVTSNLGRIPLLSTDDRSVALTVNELCVLAMIGVLFFTVLSTRRFQLDRVAVTALAFAGVGACSAMLSTGPLHMSVFELGIALSYLGRWLMYFAVYLAVINAVHEGGVERLWRGIETMLLALATFGIFQSAFLPDFAQMVYPDSREYIDWDVQGHRLVSTILDPNIAGTLLMIGLLIMLSRASLGVKVSGRRILVIFVALVLTLSRSAVVGLVFGGAVLFAARGLSRRLVRWVLATGGLVLLSLPVLIPFGVAYGKFSIGSGSSAAARLESWALTLRIIGDHPWLGVGFNAYKYAARELGSDFIGTASYGADGGLLFIMAMTGVVGLAVYCAMLWQVIGRCRALWRDAGVPPEGRALAIGTAAATVGVIAQSVFVNAILTTIVMQVLWVVWGLTFVVARARVAGQAPARLAPERLVALAA
jgi:O-antigen ligase